MERKTIWDGNVRVGEDVITTDRDGLTHIAHYDSHNSLVGRSYETRDYRGDVYMVHEDARGNRLGYSTLERDWWGDYYIKTEKTRWGREQEEIGKQDKSGFAEKSAEADDLSPLIDLLYAVAMVGVKIFIGLLGYAFVAMSSLPLAAELLMTTMNNSGNASFGLFGFLSVIVIAYFPYVGILLYRRWKKRINWKDFFLAILRWYLIGPFAYRWLLKKQNAETEKTGQAEKPLKPNRMHTLSGWQCPNCGKKLSADARFCSACGTERPAA